MNPSQKEFGFANPKVDLELLKKKFPFITDAFNRKRGNKRYLTVKFDYQYIYHDLVKINKWLQQNGFPHSHITSGGVGGGTIRINDTWGSLC